MKKRGASLIWAIIVSMVLFTIAVTTSNFVMKESQMSTRIDDSAKAYAAAESGIEWGKYCLSNIPTCTNATYTYGPYSLDKSTYTVTISASKTKIVSLGTSNGVNRKLEYTVTPKTQLGLITNPTTSPLTITGSYVQEFDFWATSTNYSIGLGNGGNKAIYFKYNSGMSAGLYAVNNATYFTTNSNLANLSGSGIAMNSEYAIHVRIDYTNNLSAKMTLSERDFTGNRPALNCIAGSFNIDLRASGISPSDLTKFYYAEGGFVKVPVPAVASVGDGTTYTFGTGAHFDNMALGGASVPAPPSTIPLSSIAAIVGTPRVGQALTAGAITPAGATVAYQWMISSTAGGTYTNIAGATTSGYTPVAGNVTKFLKVKATGTGNYTGTVTSAATSAIMSDVPSAGWFWGRVGTILEGKLVHDTDTIPSQVWGPTATACPLTHCDISGSDRVLKSPQIYPDIDFSLYPPQNECKLIGGRLPNKAELVEVITGRASYGNNLALGNYWSANTSSSVPGYSRGVTNTSGSIFGAYNFTVNRIRCIKD